MPKLNGGNGWGSKAYMYSLGKCAAIVIAATVLLTGKGVTQTVVTAQPGRYERPFDQGRGVLSYADMLDKVYRFTVRIDTIVLQRSKNDKLEMGAGNGTGFIVDAERGLVLTNAHVVENAKAIGVELPDGTHVIAKIVGVDQVTDLVLLQAPMTNATAAVFADSSTLRVGDVVFTIGYPLGLDRSVSMGIISGVNRQGFYAGSKTKRVDSFIQTDAAINPGNSGGPLINSRGQVVGVNTFILRKSDGLGFAVPSRVASVVAKQLASYGKVRRGIIGVRLTSLTPKRAKAVGVAVAQGALVLEVFPGTPARRAGLKAGDVITGAGHKRINNQTDLINFALLAKVGVPQALYVQRGSEVLKLSMVIRDASSDRGRKNAEGKASAAARSTNLSSFYGLIISNAPRSLTRKNKYQSAPVVSDVANGSLAAQKGIKEGDRILAVNQQAVNSVAELTEKMNAINDTMVAWTVRRDTLEFLVLFPGGR
jgi:serine protease DegQ